MNTFKQKRIFINFIISYIPNRCELNMDASYHLLQNTPSPHKNIDKLKQKFLIDTCNGIDCNNSTILNMKTLAVKLKCSNTNLQSNKICLERVLKAPAFRDDFYLNLIDWSLKCILAVALVNDLYLCNLKNNQILELFTMRDSPHYITSVSWSRTKNELIAVGFSNGYIEIWDTDKKACIRQFKSHITRVSSLSWNTHILTSGSLSGDIHNYDIRIANHHVSTLTIHNHEVCGLEWSPNGRFLASGADDNIVTIWDSIMSSSYEPFYKFKKHKSAVKALAWCPWQNNLIASGGGGNDCTIKVWNINNGNILRDKYTKTQITSLIWSKCSKEIISSHGHPKNQVTIWKYEQMTKVCELFKHSDRILKMVISPNQQMIASAGADQKVVLWKCFGKDQMDNLNDNYSNLLGIIR